MQMIRVMTGIDPEKEVDYLTFFACGDLDRNPTFLVVVKGSFDNAVVERRLAKSVLGQGMTVEAYKGKRIHRGLSAGYCVLEGPALLFGDPTLLRGAIDAVDAEPRSLPAALKNVLDRTDGKSVVWVAGRPHAILDHDALADWWKENRQLQRALRKIECVSLFLETTDDGVLVNALGCLAGPDQARSLYDYLSERKQALLHLEGSNVFLCSFLLLSKLETAGQYVKGWLRLTESALMELWNTDVIISPSGAALGPRSELLDKGEFDKAIANYTKAIRLDPKELFAYMTYVNRGDAWQAKGEHEKAIANYTEAIRLDQE